VPACLSLLSYVILSCTRHYFIHYLMSYILFHTWNQRRNFDWGWGGHVPLHSEIAFLSPLTFIIGMCLKMRQRCALLHKTILSVLDILLTFYATLAVVVWATLFEPCTVRITVAQPSPLKGFTTPPFTRVTWYPDIQYIHYHTSPGCAIITHA
jgi:hypothetical protein